MSAENIQFNREWFVKITRSNPGSFAQHALDLFCYQYASIPLYRQFADLMDRPPQKVQQLHQIPFLPISFFKTAALSDQSPLPDFYFESSGTTGMIPSRHYVPDLQLYEFSFRKTFQQFYQSPSDWCILALLPAYLERRGSSLVYMAEDLIRHSGHPDSGFYLHNQAALHEKLKELEARGQQTLLLGVSFALLDFAADYPLPLKHTVIMETGGMKGRKEEITRSALHGQLKKAFSVDAIHAEYGMTELLSQAYSSADGIYQSPPWMKVILRAEDDPLDLTLETDRAMHGAVNIIDLANVHSCAFIATEDVGRLYPNGQFEILGRMDQSDIRGCSLLAV